MFTELTDFLDSFLKMGIPGYDCLVMHKGKAVYRHFNGYSDIENKIKMNGKEKYNIYSCSKPITCTAALQLYEKGLFGLDDKLSDYMPEFKEMTVKTENEIEKAKNSITIKDLFCMTAGFSYDLDSPELQKAKKATNGRCPTRETIKYLAEEPLLFEPGEKWNYSLCHDVLAAFVEIVSGERFGLYVKKNIFNPLGMNDSTFLLPDSELDTVSAHYIFCDGQPKLRSKIPPFKLGSEYESGGAGCISTVEDYIKFLEALRIGNIILKNETIDLMSTNMLSEKQISAYHTENYGYGLGVRCPIDETKSDFGWNGAAGAHLAIDRKNDITVYYAQHMLSSPNQNLRRNITDIVTEIIKNN